MGSLPQPQRPFQQSTPPAPAPAPLPSAAIMLARRLVMTSGGRKHRRPAQRAGVSDCVGPRAFACADIEVQLADTGLDRVTLIVSWTGWSSIHWRIG